MTNWPVLRSLNLARNRIAAESLDAVLGRRPPPLVCSSLTALDLSSNGLTAFPASLEALKCLSKLNLSFNSIRESRFDDVLFDALDQLTDLDVSQNKLSKLPEAVVFLPKLDALNIENNDIRDVPPELGAHPTLRTLLIMGNPQRVIRQAVVRSGSAAVLEALAKRLPA